MTLDDSQGATKNQVNEDVAAPALMELEGISKSYGDLRAVDDVDVRLEAGEIHALLGENGAGKSTLVKVLNGVTLADSGTIRWNGETVDIKSPAQAREMGIGVVFQHFSLFRALTVAENIALGTPGARPEDVTGRIVELSDEYGFALDPDARLHDLSVGQWQRVEIVRCLLGDPRLLVLDEPTSVLTPQEAELLFVALRRLVAQGCAVLYISHRLSEIRALCDRATVLRAGKVVARCDPGEESVESLARKMIGHKPAVPARAAAKGRDGPVCLEVKGLGTAKATPFGVALRDVRLSLGTGEIMGIAGIAGNGQQELGEALSGERPVEEGVIFLNGEDIGRLPPAKRRKLGMHFIPEERLRHGAVADMAMWENASMTARRSQALVNRGLMRRAKARKYCDGIIEDFNVVCDNSEAKAASLSGGNLQKFIIGNEIRQKPKLVVVMQPTWGVDAGAAALIHQSLLDLAASGTAVLAISQDLDEILSLCDVVAVIADGGLSYAVPAAEATPEQLGLLMGAVRKTGHVTAP